MRVPGRTMPASLPPNSRVTRLKAWAAAPMIFLPVSIEPVKTILSMPGCCDRCCPMSAPPVTTLTTPGGSPASWKISASLSRHDMPHGDHQRPIPRGDGTDHANRLAADHDFCCSIVLNRLLRQFQAGRDPRPRRGAANLEIGTGSALGLALLPGDEFRQFLVVALDQIGDGVELRRALRIRERGPCGKCAARGLHRGIDMVQSRYRARRHHAAVSRIQHIDGGRGCDRLPGNRQRISQHVPVPRFGAQTACAAS